MNLQNTAASLSPVFGGDNMLEIWMHYVAFHCIVRGEFVQYKLRRFRHFCLFCYACWEMSFVTWRVLMYGARWFFGTCCWSGRTCNNIGTIEPFLYLSWFNGFWRVVKLGMTLGHWQWPGCPVIVSRCDGCFFPTSLYVCRIDVYCRFWRKMRKTSEK